ncbi:hypothetical protein BT93_A2137 [Corymbia citriodora subsp. variegata]|nr:hypothetical protein BT93_A2137 [Corymbia citriodora subsp. variegata]
MQKVIIQVDWKNEKSKKQAIKMVSQNEDVDSFSVDAEKKQLTLNGDMDPVPLVKKMRRKFPTDIITMSQMAAETPQPEIRPDNGSSHYPDSSPQPSAPPYPGDDNGYHRPQFNPFYVHPQYPNLPNWQPPYGGYNGYGYYNGYPRQ